MFADMGLGNVDDSQTYPYQEALLYDEYKKVDKLAAKLEETLGKKFRIVVKDSTPREDPDDYEDEDDPRADFVLTVTPETRVDEIKDLIKNKWKDLEEIHDELDSTSPITLVMNGKTLFSGKTMGDYKIGEAPKTGPKWRSPYAGVVWIVPFHLEPNFQGHWGSISKFEDRYESGLLFAEWET